MTDDTDDLGADEGLDELDRHARAAASALLAQMEQLVDDGDETDRSAGAELAASPSAPPTDESVPDAPDPHVIPLGKARSRPGSRTRRRRALAGAAAVAALVVAGGAIALADGEGTPDVTSGAAGGALLPVWLPDGLEPLVAVDLSRAEPADRLSGEIAVYGDQDATDPWAETLAVTHFVMPEESAADWQPDEGETVTVAGHDATVSEIDGLDSDSRGPGSQVQWHIEDGRMGVAGTNMTRDEVLVAAANVTDGPGIAADGLPAGFTELARGPLDAAAPTLGISYPPAGLAVTYHVPDEDDGVTMLYILQRPAPASAVDLLLGSPDSEAITVRDTHAVVSRDHDRGIAVQWAEPEGQLVTVWAAGFTEQAVLQVVERLRPADAGQIEALLAEHAPPPPGEFGDVAAGQVEVASGAVPDGGRWRVVADPAAGESMDALTIEHVSADGGSSSGSSSGSYADTAGVPPALEVWSDSTEGGAVVYGVVAAEAATVTVEAAGHEPVSLELHTVDGWDHRVVASFVPLSGFEAVAVARAADGREVARTIVYLETLDPILPDATSSGATDGLGTVLDETCVTALDGTETCSSVVSEIAETTVGP